MPNTFRQGLAGGGLLVALGLAVHLGVHGVPTNPVPIVVLSCYALGGLSWVVGSVRDRIHLGVAAISWNRAVALGTGVFTLGWGVNELSTILAGSEDPVTLSTIVTPLTALFFAWFAVECWVGGASISEDAFAT